MKIIGIGHDWSINHQQLGALPEIRGDGQQPKHKLGWLLLNGAPILGASPPSWWDFPAVHPVGGTPLALPL